MAATRAFIFWAVGILLFIPSSAWSVETSPRIPFFLDGLAQPERFIEGSFFSLLGATQYTDPRLRVNVPLLNNDSDTVVVTGRAHRIHLEEVLTLDQSGLSLPQNLTTIDFGVGFTHRLESGNQWGAQVSLGSNSDAPFSSASVLVWRMTAVYHWVVDPLHSWIFSLHYSTNSEFASHVPVPGITYLVIYPESNLVVGYGLPFFLTWRPNKLWTARFTYVIPYRINAEISYSLLEEAKLHLGFEWRPETFLLSNPIYSSSRLIFDHKRVVLGLRFPIGSSLGADVMGGYAFNQNLSLGSSVFSSGPDSASLSSAAFVEGDLKLSL